MEEKRVKRAFYLVHASGLPKEREAFLNNMVLLLREKLKGHKELVERIRPIQLEEMLNKDIDDIYDTQLRLFKDSREAGIPARWLVNPDLKTRYQEFPLLKKAEELGIDIEDSDFHYGTGNIEAQEYFLAGHWRDACVRQLAEKLAGMGKRVYIIVGKGSFPVLDEGWKERYDRVLRESAGKIEPISTGEYSNMLDLMKRQRIGAEKALEKVRTKESGKIAHRDWKTTKIY